MPVTKDKNRKAEIKECQSQRTRVGRLRLYNASHKAFQAGWCVNICCARTDDLHAYVTNKDMNPNPFPSNCSWLDSPHLPPPFQLKRRLIIAKVL